MKRNKEFICGYCGTAFTRPKNRLMNGRINHNKLLFCDGCYKECVICGKRHGKHGDTCSKECIKSLKEQTNLEKYGYKHNWNKLHPGRLSYELTMIKKYGVTHNFQKGMLRDKQNQNVKIKYGVDNVFQLEEIKRLIKITNLKNMVLKTQNKIVKLKLKQL